MRASNNISVIGVDLGGTKILASRILDLAVQESYKSDVPKNGSKEQVLDSLIFTIDQVIDETVSGIGIGVPSIVDVDNGIVYNVLNIPSWDEIHLKEILETRYDIPVFINNDANCFALGEKYFGKAQEYKHVVGMILGTGIAAGIVINNQLYSGVNCGAGEFGMISYKDQYIEYYASGQFFINVHNCHGDEIYNRAEKGDLEALYIFEEFGDHVGSAVNTILYALDPEIIVIGGSIRQSYKYFKEAMWKRINKLVYPSIAKKLKIEISADPNIPVLGAAALYYNALERKTDWEMNSTSIKI